MSQYGINPQEYGDQPEFRFEPSRRMTVSSSVMVPASDIDFSNGMLKSDFQRRRRTQALEMEREENRQAEEKLKKEIQREEKKKGIRVPLKPCGIALAVLIALCCVTLLARYGVALSTQKEITRVRNSISSYNKTNQQLEAEIAAATDISVIGYKASQELGMIPASEAKAVYLQAPSTRETTVAQEVEAEVQASAN